MAKTLLLFRHAYKTPNNHISAKGREQAAAVDLHMSGADHIFFGPLIRCVETAYVMMSDYEEFSETKVHDPIHGLGSDEMFAAMITPKVRAKVKEGLSNLDAVLAVHSTETILGFVSEGQQALDTMFAAMDDGQRGLGVFHDPTIPLLARYLGLKNSRSLKPLECLVFVLTNDGQVLVFWPNEHFDIYNDDFDD